MVDLCSISLGNRFTKEFNSMAIVSKDSRKEAEIIDIKVKSKYLKAILEMLHQHDSCYND